MGNLVSTQKPAPAAEKTIAPLADNSVKTAAVLSDIVNFAYLPQANQAPVVLFSQELFSDPCSLLGQSLITGTRTIASKTGSSLFIVGIGPCDHCNVPMVYYYENGNWKNRKAVMLSNALSAAEGYAGPRNLKNIYHLLVDKDLKITSVVNVVSPNAQGQMQVSAGCSDKLRVNADGTETRVNEKNMAEGSSSMWWLWILILLLVIAVIWIIVAKKKKY